MLLTSGFPDGPHTHHLPGVDLDERRRRHGSGRIDRSAAVRAGERLGLNLRFELGETAVPAGGHLRVAWLWPFDWATPQAEDPGAPDQVQASCSKPGVELRVTCAFRGDLVPWNHQIDVEVVSGELIRGDRVELACRQWRSPDFRGAGGGAALPDQPRRRTALDPAAAGAGIPRRRRRPGEAGRPGSRRRAGRRRAGVDPARRGRVGEPRGRGGSHSRGRGGGGRARRLGRAGGRDARLPSTGTDRQPRHPPHRGGPPRLRAEGGGQPGADRPRAPRPARLLGRPARRAGRDRLRSRLRAPPLRLGPPRGRTAALLAPGERPPRQPGPVGADPPRDRCRRRAGAVRRLPRVRVERQYAGGRGPQRLLPPRRAAPASFGPVLHRGRARPGARPGDGAGVPRGHEGRGCARQHARRREANEPGLPRAGHRDPGRDPLDPRDIGLVRPRRLETRLPRGDHRRDRRRHRPAGVRPSRQPADPQRPRRGHRLPGRRPHAGGAVGGDGGEAVLRHRRAPHPAGGHGRRPSPWGASTPRTAIPWWP